MWALGCVLAELLGAVEDNNPGALFTTGALNEILDLCGPQPESKLRTQAARETLRLRGKIEKEGAGGGSGGSGGGGGGGSALRAALATRYPGAAKTREGACALDLLCTMLAFNPEDRPSAEKCLEHPFLQSSVHAGVALRVALSSPSSIENARRLIVKEVQQHNHMIPENWEELCTPETRPHTVLSWKKCGGMWVRSTAHVTTAASPEGGR